MWVMDLFIGVLGAALWWGYVGQVAQCGVAAISIIRYFPAGVGEI